MKARELEANGLSPVEASMAARRAMGNALLAREDARAVWIWSSIENALRNIRHGARILRNSPTFSWTDGIAERPRVPRACRTRALAIQRVQNPRRGTRDSP